MRRNKMRMRGLAVLVLLAWSADAGAQVRRLELIPFAGYRWGGSMSQISWGREFNTERLGIRRRARCPDGA